MQARYKLFTWVAAVTLVFDQATKIAARAMLEHDGQYGTPVVVIQNFFDWRLSYNFGSAFGLFGGLDGARVGLTVVGLIAVAAILWMLKTATDDQRRLVWGLGLVGGGAVGNIIDRVWFGKVTDFIVWKYHTHEWPTFNIADAALVIGVGFLFLDLGKDATRADDDSAEGAKA